MLMRELAGHLTPAEYAACPGVRINTVRRQINAIFAKMGVRRIAELVAQFGD
ncbi:helix-turn-helix transcriptional regulator [Burkholderia sp. Bp9142]|uniref:helix-turn-helix transcriptional regulator n=1 Tax=Burkholderia sp. Bp9142 TaxID=2184573 RepID=UPI0021AB4E8E|nr:helix-turn-helix transcriptional regulator [Burkholderia sp. Bp9142]